MTRVHCFFEVISAGPSNIDCIGKRAINAIALSIFVLRLMNNKDRIIVIVMFFLKLKVDTFKLL